MIYEGLHNKNRQGISDKYQIRAKTTDSNQSRQLAGFLLLLHQSVSLDSELGKQKVLDLLLLLVDSSLAGGEEGG